jgi:hypothetical protein
MDSLSGDGPTLFSLGSGYKEYTLCGPGRWLAIGVGKLLIFGTRRQAVRQSSAMGTELQVLR